MTANQLPIIWWSKYNSSSCSSDWSTTNIYFNGLRRRRRGRTDIEDGEELESEDPAMDDIEEDGEENDGDEEEDDNNEDGDEDIDDEEVEKETDEEGQEERIIVEIMNCQSVAKRESWN